MWTVAHVHQQIQLHHVTKKIFKEKKQFNLIIWKSFSSPSFVSSTNILKCSVSRAKSCFKMKAHFKKSTAITSFPNLSSSLTMKGREAKLVVGLPLKTLEARTNLNWPHLSGKGELFAQRYFAVAFSSSATLCRQAKRLPPRLEPQSDVREAGASAQMGWLLQKVLVSKREQLAKLWPQS